MNPQTEHYLETVKEVKNEATMIDCRGCNHTVPEYAGQFILGLEGEEVFMCDNCAEKYAWDYDESIAKKTT